MFVKNVVFLQTFLIINGKKKDISSKFSASENKNNRFRIVSKYNFSYFWWKWFRSANIQKKSEMCFLWFFKDEIWQIANWRMCCEIFFILTHKMFFVSMTKALSISLIFMKKCVVRITFLKKTKLNVCIVIARLRSISISKTFS